MDARLDPSDLSSAWSALREQPFDLLLAIERSLRSTRTEAVARDDGGTWTGLAFRLRDRWLLAPREDVREISPRPRLTRVPGAKPWLLGVANVRGGLLPVTDLGQWLGHPAVTESRNQRVLVLNADGVPAGFLVDEVAGYRQFAPEDQSPMAADDPALEPWRIGAFQRDGRDWLAISLRKLSRSEAFVLAGA